MSTLLALASAAAAGSVAALAAPHLLRALPAPDDEPVSPYIPLATRRVALWIGLTIAALVAAVLTGMPSTNWPVWLIITTLGGFGVCIDELAMWIPKPLTHTATAACYAALATGWATHALPAHVAGRSLLAGLAMRSFFWGMWRFLGTMGFGDVRLSLLCGLGAGLVSWQAVEVAGLAGTILPIVHLLLARRQRDKFPYGPGMLVGCLAAAMLLA